MYTEIIWDKNYLLNVDEFDSQHKHLLSLVNKCIRKANGYIPDQKIEEILEDLLTYTIWHFKSEETFMEIYRLEGLKEHQEEHKNLLNDLSERIIEIKSDETNLWELAQFLQSWFGGHSFGMDKEMSIQIKKLRKNDG